MRIYPEYKGNRVVKVEVQRKCRGLYEIAKSNRVPQTPALNEVLATSRFRPIRKLLLLLITKVI